MTSSSARPATAAKSSANRLWPFALALLWCVVLGTLVFTSANPVVLNPAQIAAAQVIVQGEWVAASPPQLQVHKVWKGQLAADAIVIQGTIPVAQVTGEVLVPLSRIPGGTATSQSFQITQGGLENHPRNVPPGTPELGIVAEVLPLVYPATSESLAQLQQLLEADAEASKRGAPAAVP